ncbi:MAG: hypothetical protein ABSE73_28075 [Planctomycetota bacterium]
MAGKWMIARVGLGLVLMGGAGMALQAGEDTAGTTVTGILASKGETWIGVKTEAEEESALYLPVWKGGLPKDGGGFDKEMLAKIKGLVVGSKVKLVCKTAEEPPPRIVTVETLAPPEKKVEAAAAPEKPHAEGEGEKKKPPEGEKPVAEAEKTKKPAPGEKAVAEAEKPKQPAASEKSEKPKAEASAKQNTVTGVVTARGDDWIEVRTRNDSPPEKYYPRSEGGNPDPEILKKFKEAKTNGYAKIWWILQEKRRIVEKMENL